MYNVGRSSMPHYQEEHSVVTTKDIENKAVNNQKTSNSQEDLKITLVKTKTCPNCRIIQQVLDDNNISYDIVLADEDIDFAKKYEIRIAPTLIIETKDGLKDRVAGAGPIRAWLSSR